MRTFILSLPQKYQAVFVIGSTILIAFIISSLFGLCFDEYQLIRNRDLISSVYEVMGTVYAILLTFTLWGVWQNFIDAEAAVQNETNTLLDLVRMLEIASNINSDEVRNTILSYSRFVIEEEWPTLKDFTNEMINSRVRNHSASQQVVQAIKNINPKNEQDLVIYGQVLEELNCWLDARRIRILKARGNSAGALWPLLFTGAIVLFAFHGLFVVKNPAIWSTLLFGFSLVIGVTFYLIFCLDCPFAGSLGVDTEPFRLTINLLKKGNVYRTESTVNLDKK